MASQTVAFEHHQSIPFLFILIKGLFSQLARFLVQCHSLITASHGCFQQALTHPLYTTYPALSSGQTNVAAAEEYSGAFS